mgnify:CR=1 FL=1
MSVQNVLDLIEENDVKFVDLRFTDTKGKQQHVSIPAHVVLADGEEWFEEGQAFDGSSIGDWKGIQLTLPMAKVTTVTHALSQNAQKPI